MIKNPTQAEKIIDFQMVDLIIDRMITDMEKDLAEWGEIKTNQNMQRPIKFENGHTETPLNRVDNNFLFSFQDLDRNGR